MNPLVAFVFDRVIKIGLHLSSEREYILAGYVYGRPRVSRADSMRLGVMQHAENIAWRIEESIATRYYPEVQS